MNNKEVDCALIFMLDEEKELFLKNNKDFIITSDKNNNFTEFIFFDKNMKMRKGVMCSNGRKMGNTEACALFYKLSANYNAHLYINLGVACLISDLNIGDVLIATRISTMGENNSNDTQKQIKDLFSENKLAQEASDSLNKVFENNINGSSDDIDILLHSLKKNNINIEKYNNLANLKSNKIITGWCLTVPEVIKDKERLPELKEYRKLNLIDMEAYYIGRWFELIKDIEPHKVEKTSEFLVFKSVSDYGDTNKNTMEKCGSRHLAMKNLYKVVSEYCTSIYDFPRTENNNIYFYFNENISPKCIDSIIDKVGEMPLIEFENLFKHIIYANNACDLDLEKCISSSINIINESHQALFLIGCSGTGKSTFMSYLYKRMIIENHKAILIDFSKLTNTDMPNDVQIIKLIERLMNHNEKIIFFFDGVEKETNIYEELKKILSTNHSVDASFCIGNISEEDYDDLYDTISAVKQIAEISFNGISVYSPTFNEFISTSKAFFNHQNSNYKEDIITSFILDSKISAVDFRLLSMFATYKGNLSKKKTLHTFVKDYVNSKFGLSVSYCKYYPPFNFNNVSDNSKDKKEYTKKQKNSYYNELAIAMTIIDLFTDVTKEKENIKYFLAQEYILSNDMNLMFQHLLKQKHNNNAIIKNILDSLEEYAFSISMQTQLLYNISKIVKSDNPYYGRIKKLVINANKSAIEKLNTTDNDEQNSNLLIQYRTLCIILDKIYNEDSYLKEFNNLLLQENKFKRFNLLFHLFYYSKRFFSFNALYNFDFKNTDYEMFCNTYYTLKRTIESKDLCNDLIKQDAFIIMNIITFLHLIDTIIKGEKLFEEFIPEINQMLDNLLSKIEKILERFKNNTIVKNLFTQITEIVEKFST